jgi:hypothetical protein
MRLIVVNSGTTEFPKSRQLQLQLYAVKLTIFPNVTAKGLLEHLVKQGRVIWD